MKAFALLLALLVAAPQDKITLKPNEAKGDKISHQSTTKVSIKIDMQGQEIPVDSTSITKQVREIHEAVDGRATRLTLETTEEVTKSSSPMGVQEQNGPLHGLKVTYKIVDGKPVVETPEKLAEAAVAALEIGRHYKFLPKTPVGLGESWEIKGQDAVDLFGKKGEKVISAKVVNTLKEVKELDGKKVAVITSKIEVKQVGQPEGAPMEQTITFKAEGENIVLIEKGLSISVKMKGSMDLVMGPEDEEGALKGSGTIEIEAKDELLK